MKLNYASLSQPVTPADIAAYKQYLTDNKLSSKHPSFFVFAVIGLCAAVFTLTPLIGIAATEGVQAALTPFFIVLIVVSAVIAFVVIAIRVQTEKFAKLHKFAVENNLTFRTNIPDPVYAGMPFDEGHSRRIDEAFFFPDGGEIGNYEYTTGSGKHQTTHYWGYIRIKLNRKLPNMVLDAKKNNILGRFSTLPDSFNRSQTLPLEGDFNNYFTLYAPKEYERDALYVFTPDVMAALVDSGQSYDMEVVDDNLMIYQLGKIQLDSQSELEKLTAIIDHIGSELRDQSHRYADERVGDRTQNIVAEPGRRLKSGIGIGTIIIFILIVLYYLVSFSFFTP